MDSPPPQLSMGQHVDRISALPDDLLLEILERLNLREAVRAGAVSTRWRRLPHQLSRLYLNLSHIPHATLEKMMDAFTGAVQSLPARSKCERDGKSYRAIKTLGLGFYLSAPHLGSIGIAVEDVVSRGEIKHLVFGICSPCRGTDPLLMAESGQEFMSFSRAYPVAFSWLTRLILSRIVFGHSDVADLVSACDRLKILSLRSCRMVAHAVLKIDAPCSGIQELEFLRFRCAWIELVSVPKLRQVRCQRWRFENPPVRFGYVPELRSVGLASCAKAWQAPFALSECLPRSAVNLCKLSFNFCSQMIWIQPEHPKQLTAIFRNLTDVGLFSIIPECGLMWTLFILEAAPAVQNFALSRHSCVKKPKDCAEKTNILWEPSKNLKHFNLKLLVMIGFKEEDKVTNYIRLVMERAVGLKRIELCGKRPCKECDAKSPGTPCVDEASRHQIKERLIHECSTPVEIIIKK